MITDEKRLSWFVKWDDSPGWRTRRPRKSTLAAF